MLCLHEFVDVVHCVGNCMQKLQSGAMRLIMLDAAQAFAEEHHNVSQLHGKHWNIKLMGMHDTNNFSHA